MRSRYLLSGCCSAPIVQGYEQGTDLFPIWCSRCGQELAAPGVEDVPDAHTRIFEYNLVAFKIRHLYAGVVTQRVVSLRDVGGF